MAAPGGILGSTAIKLAVAPYESGFDKSSLEGDFTKSLKDATIDDIRVGIKFIRHWLDNAARKGLNGEDVRPVCVKGKQTVLSADELRSRMRMLENLLIEKMRSTLMDRNRKNWPRQARDRAPFGVQDMASDPQLVADVIDILGMANGRDLDYLGQREELAAVDQAAPSQPRVGSATWGEGQQDKPRALIKALEDLQKQLR